MGKVVPVGRTSGRISANGPVDFHNFPQSQQKYNIWLPPSFPQVGTVICPHFPDENTEVSSG